MSGLNVSVSCIIREIYASVTKQPLFVNQKLRFVADKLQLFKLHCPMLSDKVF